MITIHNSLSDKMTYYQVKTYNHFILKKIQSLLQMGIINHILTSNLWIFNNSGCTKAITNIYKS